MPQLSRIIVTRLAVASQRARSRAACVTGGLLAARGRDRRLRRCRLRRDRGRHQQRQNRMHHEIPGYSVDVARHSTLRVEDFGAWARPRRTSPRRTLLRLLTGGCAILQGDAREIANAVSAGARPPRPGSLEKHAPRPRGKGPARPSVLQAECCETREAGPRRANPVGHCIGDLAGTISRAHTAVREEPQQGQAGIRPPWPGPARARHSLRDGQSGKETVA